MSKRKLNTEQIIGVLKATGSRPDGKQNWRARRAFPKTHRRIWVLLRWEGTVVNHKRLFRIYRAAGLSVKRKRRKRLVRVCQPRTLPTVPMV